MVPEEFPYHVCSEELQPQEPRFANVPTRVAAVDSPGELVPSYWHIGDPRNFHFSAKKHTSQFLSRTTLRSWIA